MQNKLNLIDSHVHIFPEAVAPKAIKKLQITSGLTPYTDGTLGDTKEKIAKSGVDYFIALNIATAPKQQATINNTAKAINDSEPHISALGSVHPQNPDCLTELERIKSLGIKGIKLHPDYQDFMIDDDALFPIYQRCRELELPIVFHAGWDCYSPDLVHAPPERSAKMLKKFSGIKTVLAHMGGLMCWDRVETELCGKNVWFDTAMAATYCDKDVFMRLINKHDVNRILFGSDCPWENPRKTFEYIDSMPLSDDAKEKIFYKNAIEFFNL